jgi:hypothetical protein
LPNYLITESKTQKEINISKGLYAYIESEYKNKKIGLDGTVWYPYKYFVAAKPYHPFSSQRPKICNTCISWHPDQPMEIWENEIVVFNQRFPPYYLTEEKTNYTPVNWEEILKEFNIQTQTYFQLDTVIGSNRVYKRK